MYKIIYTNGCSWTSGVDTANDIIFPGLSFNEITKQKEKWFKNQEFDKIAEIYLTEKQLAWPRLLSKITELDVVQSAHGGSSQEQIDITSKEDILKLLLEYDPTEILVIIQCTMPYRTIYPNLCNFLEHESKWASLLANEYQGYNKAEKSAIDALVSWPDNYIFYKYYNDILSTVDFCKARNIEIKLLQVWNHNTYPSMLLDEIKQFYVGTEFLSDLCKGDLANGHPTPAGHIKIAQYVVNSLGLLG